MTNAFADRVALRRVLVLAALALGFWLISVLLHDASADARPASHRTPAATHSATHPTTHSATKSAPGLDQVANRTVRTVARTVDRTVVGVDKTVTRVVHTVTGRKAGSADGTAADATRGHATGADVKSRPRTHAGDGTLDALVQTVHTTTRTVRTSVKDVTDVATTAVHDIATGRPLDQVAGRAVHGLVHTTVGHALDSAADLVTDPAGLPATVVTGGFLAGDVLPGISPTATAPVSATAVHTTAGRTAHRVADEARALVVATTSADAHRAHATTTDGTAAVDRSSSDDLPPATPGPADPSEGGKPGSPSPARGGGDLGSLGLVTTVTPTRNELLEGTPRDDLRLFGVVAREPGFSPD